jgi:hypothetical protein
VRGLSAARHALWSSRWPRAARASPWPDYWPASADLSAAGAGDVPELDDPRVDLPVARGPLPSGFVVHERLLDPARGLRRGESVLVRHPPLLAKLGTYELDVRHRFLDDKWQYQRSEWPDEGALLPENAWRRIPVIYRLPGVSASYLSAYAGAVGAILGAPFRDDLAPLESWKDEELVDYALRFGWPVPRRDFHPRLERFCSLDHATADERVQTLIDHIQGKVERDGAGNLERIPSVAEVLAKYYIAFYRRVIDELNRRISASASPIEIARMRAEIADLQSKISVLEQFLARLQNSGP